MTDCWEVLEIIGEDIIDGQTHYMVDWMRTREVADNINEAMLAEWTSVKQQKRLKKSDQSSNKRGSSVVDNSTDNSLDLWKGYIISEEDFKGKIRYVIHWLPTLELPGNIVDKGLIKQWEQKRERAKLKRKYEMMKEQRKLQTDHKLTTRGRPRKRDEASQLI